MSNRSLENQNRAEAFGYLSLTSQGNQARIRKAFLLRHQIRLEQ